MLTGTDVDGPLDGVAQPRRAPGRQRRGRELHGDAMVPLRVRPRRAVAAATCAPWASWRPRSRARTATATSGRWCAPPCAWARSATAHRRRRHEPSDAPQALSRRTILRGAGGAAIALPWLEAMAPRRAQAATAPVKRFIVMFSANGTIPSAWTPTAGTSETDFTLSPILSPLEAHKADIVVVSGLEQKGGGGDGHQNGIGGMLTGQMLNAGPFAGVGAAPAGWPMGPSVDQRIAEGLAVPTQAAIARAGRAGRRRRQLGADDLPRRQPAAAARRRSGQRLRARVLRPAHRSGGARPAAQADGSRSSTASAPSSAACRRAWAAPTGSGWTRT